MHPDPKVVESGELSRTKCPGQCTLPLPGAKLFIPGYPASKNVNAENFLLKFDLKFRTRSYPFAVSVENYRDRAHGQGDECEKRISPAEPEGFVHGLPG